MKIEFRHKGCEVPADVRELSSSAVERLAKYLDPVPEVEVFFAQETTKSSEQRYRCELTLVSKGRTLRAGASGSEMIQAFDRSVDKARHQLERLKGKLVGRSHPHHRSAKVVSPEDLERAPITREKSFALSSLEPEEAAFEMDLLSHSFYLFQNVKTGATSVVYRRNDGTVGLIDAVQ